MRGVNFGATSEAKNARPKVPGPKNRRAEMWQRMQEALAAPEGFKLPDDDALQTDLTSPRLKPQLNNDFLLESKDEMKKRGVKSPDLGDSVALTFATREFYTDYQAHDTGTPAFVARLIISFVPTFSYLGCLKAMTNVGLNSSSIFWLYRGPAALLNLPHSGG